jgi:MFS family permease
MAQGVASAIMPAVALWLLLWVGYAGVFLISALAAFLGAATVLGIQARARPRPPATGEGFWRSLIEPTAVFPSVLEFLTKVPLGVGQIFIPMYALYRGIPIEQLAFYFLVYGLVSVLSRGTFGAWSDRVGRGWAIITGALILVAGLLLISQATNIVLLTLGGALFSSGLNASGPSVMALAVDRAPADRRGAAMATYSMSFQLGQGGGAALWGLLIEAFGFQFTYLAAAVPPLLATILAARLRGERAPTA